MYTVYVCVLHFVHHLIFSKSWGGLKEMDFDYIEEKRLLEPCSQNVLSQDFDTTGQTVRIKKTVIASVIPNLPHYLQKT